MTIKITKREALIIKALVKRTAEGKDTFTLDWMIEEVYAENDDKPEFYRSALAHTIRNLAYKLYLAGGYRLKRISGLGLRAKAEYEFAGDFAKLRRDLKREAA